MILTVAVENYRSLRRLILPLGQLTVITGANGTGKSSLYRSLRLLADAARNGAVAALAREGGLPSTVWAGPEGGSRFRKNVHRPVQGTTRTGPVSLKLGFVGDTLGYAIDLGLPNPASAGPTTFGFDPEIKREWVWAAPSPRPSALLADRHNNVVRLRDGSGSWVTVTDGLRAFDSMLTELADPLVAPELFVMREQLRSWRFYDHLRTDALAPARASHIGTRTLVLGSDGADLAAALQTIIEIGDAAALRETIDDAFPLSRIDIEVQSGHFELVMRQQGLLRPLRAPELSDGTMRYLLLAAALLTPRPPELLVLNEPETSLHEELLAPLAALISAAARKCQIVIVSHSAVLIDALGRSAASAQILQLVKEAGQTKLVGQEPLDEPALEMAIKMISVARWQDEPVTHIRIGVDTGGTFTDVVAVDTGTGRVVTTKTPSTPTNPADGFLTGITKILHLLGATVVDVEAILHGTTVATNQLLQGKVGELGFITTTGYESMLEIARQSVPDGYGNSYFWVKPDRIVPADRVRTVGGRLDFRGNELRPFDLKSATEAVRFFRHNGISTLAVCFLHSYANDDHERLMADVIAADYPEAVFSLSSQVLPEYREYERAMTTLIDAAVKPTVASYVLGIADRLAALDPTRRIPFSIMRSNGGVLSAAEVVHQPISTVLSGPAAGALGAAVIADRAGYPSVVTCDGGGTSTDVTVITGSRPTLTTEGSVGPFPAKIPMIDVVTVGAGGGSVAWISVEGTLKVGPRSAGADPGPACYELGGLEPTVTDAQLVLGRIPPHLLGGEIPLDTEAASVAVSTVAEPLGLSIEDCAAGILEISAWNQANALRRITTKRGLDVRDFPLVTFGGSGSLLGCRLMDILDIGTVLVPPNPGNVSAYGLLTVDVRGDYVRTAVTSDRVLDLGALSDHFAALTTQAREALQGQGFTASAQVIEWSADLRYLGQAFEVRVPCSAGEVSRQWADSVVDAFHDAHNALYGYDFRGKADQQVEWVNLRVTGIGPIPRPEISEIASGAGESAAGSRRVHFGNWTSADLHDRSRLGAGDVVVGPAVIQEFGSTVPISPGFRAVVDRFGNVIITRIED